MGDFFQNGVITTLHNLTKRPVAEIERELVGFSKDRPMGLVLPSLFSELEGPALGPIIDHIAQVPFLDEIVIGLDRANLEQYQYALKYFDRLPQRHRVLWNDGPRLREIDALLKDHGLAPKEMGKGRNVWYCFGYMLASNRAKAVALHDCDIVTYDRDLLAKLFYPVANPQFGYKFCKGYYSRFSNGSLNGRVCRLLVTPLIRALKINTSDHGRFLDYLDSFRYPLSGEFSMQMDVLRDARIPSDWGLEMGIISEMYRNYASNRICQVDISDCYDHKHQDMSATDATKGLSKMSIDISKNLYRKLATQGECFSPESFRTLKATYYRVALDCIESYHSDAMINGLTLDRHKEEMAVELFAQNIISAGNEFLDKPMDKPFMPSWARVMSAIPDILDRLLIAVDEDAREFSDSTRDFDAGSTLRRRVQAHLDVIYPEENTRQLSKQLLKEAGLPKPNMQIVEPHNCWNQQDVAVITYGDSLLKPTEKPLETLRRFLTERMSDIANTVHILPFCPFSSDDGFSVIDYQAINPELGDWGDIESISKQFRIMADLVINHCSVQSEWFQNFIKGSGKGHDYFITEDPDTDLDSIVRPRSSPLLTPVETSDGTKHVWSTFSPDQVDLNFKKPEVLLECMRIIKSYLDHGVSLFRFDAVGFLWKQLGTTGMHLTETHELIRVMRLLLEHCDDQSVVVTETNVPNHENLSYFGNGNEAHLIYNFSMPPLLLNALLTGSSKHLKTWMMTMPPAQFGRGYFNFIASHDGIGLRPTEGLLADDERQVLMDKMREFGGEISMRQTADGGEKPYEINISLFDAFKGTIDGEDDYQVARFLCAHTILLALEGIPAIYIHSFLGTENDQALRAETGRARSINRHRWHEPTISALLDDPSSHHALVFEGLSHLINVRKHQGAFHPNATQYTLHFGDAIFAFWRQSLNRDQSIFALNNITNSHQCIPLSELNLIGTDTWTDLISGKVIDPDDKGFELAPYQCIWLANS